MSDLSERLAGLSPEKRELLARRLRETGRSRAARREPVAVIGLGCRFPGGADSPQAFWRLLKDGVDAIREVPPDRWEVDAVFDPDVMAPGKMATRWGGFLDEIDRFDPEFFDLTPREAERMDPQQRLLLETAWEALEDAGVTADGLAGSSTGVFVGVHSHSSEFYWLQSADPGAIDTYTSTGTAHSIVANRLSYWLDLRGPSMAVDSACSSSLVAVHLAVQSLWNEECDLAVAGGVNLMLTPEVSITFSKLQIMAADGRCKAFDARADGMVRGEGCGVVLLKRLSDALRDRDPIRALIRGSAVNQDGHTNGITAPNGLSQQRVIRQALQVADVDPERIGYVEAHGTGTTLGDPIELEALIEVLGGPREPGRECAVGSVKTNFGHLEAAAGIAGLIKTVLCLENRCIPPHLHFTSLNPHVPADRVPFVIPVSCRPWDAGPGRRLAGVSSFGFGGTNAHVVLEEAPEAGPESAADGKTEAGPYLLPLSARGEEALRRLAGRYADRIDSVGGSSADVCYSASCRRTHHSVRLAVVGSSGTELAERLRAAESAEPAPGLFPGGESENGETGLVWVFSGQGPQRAAMGLELMEHEPVFRATLERIDRLLARLAGWSLIETLRSDAAKNRLERTEIAQPAIFAIQVALAELLMSWGLAPDAIVGHSMGEVAAAEIAGALNLEDAVRVIVHRGRVSAGARPGGMAAVEMSEEEAVEAIAPYAGRLGIAAVNGPASVTLAGEESAIDEFLVALEERERFGRRLQVAFAAHGPDMRRPSEELETELAGLDPRPARIPIFSTVTGEPAEPAAHDAAYWGRNLRRPVRFAAAVGSLLDRGFRTFLELGPHPTLGPSIDQCLSGKGLEGRVLASMHRDEGERQACVEAVAGLYAAGCRIDWQEFHSRGGRYVRLPSYPWQRRRVWIRNRDERPTGTPVSGAARGAATPVRPTGWRRLRSPDLRDPVYEGWLGAGEPSFLEDHRIGGRVVVPAPLLVEMIAAAAADSLGDRPLEILDFSIRRAMILPARGGLTVQLVMRSGRSEEVRFELFSLGSPEPSEESWTVHASGLLRPFVADAAPRPVDLAEAPTGGADEIPGRQVYREFRRLGIEFGPSFRSIETIRLGTGEAWARLRLPPALESDTGRFRVHPVLLDAGLQAMVVRSRPDAEPEGTITPFVGADRWILHRRAGRTLTCHVHLRGQRSEATETVSGDASWYDESGELVASVEGARFRPASLASLLDSATADVDQILYEVEWRPRNRLGRADSRTGIPELPAPDQIAEELRRRVDEERSANRSNLGRDLVPELDRISAAFAVRALERLGWDPDPGERFTAPELADRLGVVEPHHRLLERMLGMLEEEGRLKRAGRGWRVRETALEIDPVERLAPLGRRHPECATEITLFQRCGRRLPDVLRGEADPLQILFPEGSLESTAKLYRDAATSRLPNELVRRAVRAAASGLPRDRVIRVLEIGAGTGGTTAGLLPELPPGRTDYVFTDLSPAFLKKARDEFREFPFVRYRTLDIESESEDQGFGPRQFDLVIASNVLHATADLRESLGHVRRMMSPHALLCVVEGVRPTRWIDLTFGLTEGWWRFCDTDLRPHHPLLSRPSWLEVLAAAGFDTPAGVSAAPDEAGGLFEQAVFLAGSGRPDPDAADSAREEPLDGRRWLVFADRSGVGSALAERLESRGAAVDLVRSGEGPPDAPPDGHRTAPGRAEEFRRLIPEFLEGEDPDGRWVVDLRGLDERPEEDSASAMETATTRCCADLVLLLRALLEAEGRQMPRLWVATRGGCALPGDTSPRPAQASLWGLGQVIAREHPELWGGLVDLDPESSDDENAASLLDQCLHPGGEDRAAFRFGSRFVARLVPSRGVSSKSLSWSDTGSYLITGGMGDLGLAAARWMAARGARRLLLLGRTPLPPRAEWERLSADDPLRRRTDAIREMESGDVEIRAAAVDVADEHALRRCLAESREAGWSPIRGVVHTAAVIDDRLLSQLDEESLSSVLRPKVAGAWNLHRMLKEEPLEFFVLYSSLGSILGQSGQASYAAANAFLDALAHLRRAGGDPALSVDWGAWTGAGFAVTPGGRRTVQALSRRGIDGFSPEQGVRALERLLRRDATQTLVMRIDRRRFREAYPVGTEPPLFSELGREPEGREADRPADSPGESRESSLMGALTAAESGPERRALLESHLTRLLSDVLGVKAESIDRSKPMGAMGLDSLMAFELKKRCEGSLGLTLSATLAWNYPTIDALATHLAAKLDMPLDASVETSARGGPAPDARSVDDGRESVDRLSEEEALNALLGERKESSE